MNMKKLLALLLVLTMAVALLCSLSTVAFAAEDVPEETEEAGDKTTGTKAVAAAAVFGVVAAAGAIGMAISIRKSVESMARQPEAAGKINSAMMLGLVFIETTSIYALIVAILIIFVL